MGKGCYLSFFDNSIEVAPYRYKKFLYEYIWRLSFSRIPFNPFIIYKTHTRLNIYLYEVSIKKKNLETHLPLLEWDVLPALIRELFLN